ncbi:UbiD family decarboxylase [Desulfotomaculum copahuensis]|uniref:UbiD family decarboxylase n=1 Tax=Desulfotomaculum copahuensis TaxID=1838280 RepID=A0A1B7LKL4_9FIRM|nr:UbiD family decarboxylase [Desulfotomaculum copahuensis]OAT87099.1 UbiD family decarboxylase [Desulfotomaculum copahuensis]
MNEKFKNIILTLIQEKDSLKKSLGVLAVLTEALKPVGVKPILVGGRALEFYTLGGYATKDMDLVINGREQAKTVLATMGFLRRPGERHWYHEELDLALEIPDGTLAGSPDKLSIVEINGMEAFIIGIEDLIIDRLAAAKFWNSPADAQWAAKLLALHAREIDMNYLQNAAYKEQVEDILKKVIKHSKIYLDVDRFNPGES